MNSLRTEEERCSIAVGWKVSGLPQAKYAAAHGVSERTLRTWLRTYSPSRTPSVDDLRKIVSGLITELENVRDQLDALAAQRLTPTPLPVTRMPRSTGPAPTSVEVRPCALAPEPPRLGCAAWPADSPMWILP